jgi:hypothetical protein
MWLRVMPIGMTAYHSAMFLNGLIEGRVRLGYAMFAMAYFSTILPAIKGDITPFMNIQMMAITNSR